MFAGGHIEPRCFSRWMRNTCARLISRLLSVMKRLGSKAPDHTITPEYPEARKDCLFFYTLLNSLPKDEQLWSTDICIWVFRQWITKWQIKQKMKQRIPPSVYLLLTDGIANAIHCTEHHQHFRGQHPDCQASCCYSWVENLLGTTSLQLHVSRQ